MLIISRNNSYADKARRYKVIIDENCYAEISNGERKNIDISPGSHTIYVKIDWCRSNKIQFNSLENKTVEFECGNSMNRWRQLFSLFYITFFKNNYLWIKEK